MKRNVSGNKHKGRPRKYRPEPSKEALLAVKDILSSAQGYKGAKGRIEYTQKHRPSLLKRLKVDLKQYKSDGLIEYDQNLASKIHPDDQKVIKQYREDMRTVWIIECGIEAIPDKHTREIAYDTLLRGIACVKLTGKYGITDRAIRKQKRVAILYVAAILEMKNEF